MYIENTKKRLASLMSLKRKNRHVKKKILNLKTRLAMYEVIRSYNECIDNQILKLLKQP